MEWKLKKFPHTTPMKESSYLRYIWNIQEHICDLRQEVVNSSDMMAMRGLASSLQRFDIWETLSIHFVCVLASSISVIL